MAATLVELFQRFPFEDTPLEGYVKNYLKKHHWKIARILDFDDAVQEAAELHYRLLFRLHRSNSTIENDKHMMSLFKTSWSRHFITLSNKATEVATEIAINRFENEEEDATLDIDELGVAGDLNNDGYLWTLVEEAPKEVKQVLNLLLNPSPALEKAYGSKRGRTTNQWLCALLGYDSTKIDLVKTVETYFI